tara:strand:- start:7287 stop:7487 length:201 start_codon:yes stop_codon:yes gene_type:complete
MSLEQTLKNIRMMGVVAEQMNDDREEEQGGSHGEYLIWEMIDVMSQMKDDPDHLEDYGIEDPNPNN